MDPFYGTFPLTVTEKVEYRYPVNRITSSFTPLEIDFNEKTSSLDSLDSELLTSPLSKSLIDSLFDSDSELSEIDYLEIKSKRKLPLNPFKIQMDQVEQDWKLIRQFVQKTMTENVKTKTLNMTREKRSTVIYTSINIKKANQESDDNCTVCLGKGKVICCDSCPRVFHLYCLDHVLDEKRLPEFWECNSCRGNTQIDLGFHYFFGELLQGLNGKNPRIFQLPLHITNSFENISAHPKTGNFMINSEMEVINFITSNQVGKGNPTIKRNNVITESDQLLNSFCYKCSRSNLKLLQTNLLSSYSIMQPKGLKLQTCNSDLIKCDFCPLYWHLDCLDPPLASVPPELRENEIEIVNLRSLNAIKEKIWGRESPNSSAGTLNSRCSLDELVSIRKKWMCPCHSQNVGNIQPSGWKWCTVYEDPESDIVAGGDEILLFSKSSQNNGNIEIRNDRDTNTLFEEIEHVNSKRTIRPIDRFEIDGIRYRVPEKRIKLDFFAKTSKTTPKTKPEKYRVLPNGQLEFDKEVLDAMFPGYNSKFKLIKSDDSLNMLLEAAKNIDDPQTLAPSPTADIEVITLSLILVFNSNVRTQ